MLIKTVNLDKIIKFYLRYYTEQKKNYGAKLCPIMVILTAFLLTVSVDRCPKFRPD